MLITFDEAKLHLRIKHDSDDDDILAKTVEASAIVLDYLDLPEDTWQSTSGEPQNVPHEVKAAVKLVLGGLFENRDGTAYGLTPQPLSQAVMDLLHRRRTPAMA